MSIQTKLKKAVEVLLKGLHQVKEKVADEDIKCQIKRIETILNEKKDQFTAVKECEQELIERLRDLDGQLGRLDNRKMENIDMDSMRSSIDSSVKPIKEWVFLPHAEFTTILNTSTRNDDDKGPTQTQTPKHPQPSLEDPVFQEILKNLRVSYDNLRPQFRLCSLFLSIFPENSAIKKRVLIYCWVGKGLVRKTESKTAEEVGEDIFDELLQLELIIPYGKVKSKSPIVNTCQIHPWFRYVLVQLAQEGSLFHSVSSEKPPSSESSDILLLDGQHFSGKESNFEDYTTIFNVNARYVHFGSEWLAKMKKLVVLQLGRWQESPKHHIEVVNDPFFNDFKTQKQCLKYLSLRGISRIIALPPSILELVSLEILDLKACHNLEILPPDISSLSKLTHLDVSQCYLLESMPKGLNKLASLQVLKGFIVGNLLKDPTKIGDLQILGELKRLSIHTGSEAEIQKGELNKLKGLKSLRRLKISWAVVSNKLKAQVEKEDVSFPPSLEKLNLEGLPHEELPTWLKPSNLKALKKLYIMGGKFKSLDHDKTETWKVEILRLKYLNNLKIRLDKLQDTFPSLKYAQRIEKSSTAREYEEWWKEN